jgi:hypothetical protein
MIILISAKIKSEQKFILYKTRKSWQKPTKPARAHRGRGKNGKTSAPLP